MSALHSLYGCRVQGAEGACDQRQRRLLKSSSWTLDSQSHLLRLYITLYMGELDSIYGCTWLFIWVHLTLYMDALDSRNGFAWLQICEARGQRQCYRVNVTHRVLMTDDLCLHLTLYMAALDSEYGCCWLYIWLNLTLYMAVLDSKYAQAAAGACGDNSQSQVPSTT